MSDDRDDQREVERADELLAGQGAGSTTEQQEGHGEAGDLLPGVEGEGGSFLR